MLTEEEVRGIISILSDSDYREGKTEYLEEIREIQSALKPHFDDDYPAELLSVQHPGEESWAKKYREDRWTNPSLMVTGRIFTSLQKIQQSDDFRVKIETDPVKTGIAEVNGFADYLTKSFPKFGSLETWTFDVFLREYLSDPNAVALTLPDLTDFIKNPQTAVLDFTKPYPQIFSSKKICYKRENAVIVKVKSWKHSSKKEWDQFLAVSSTGLALVRQIGAYSEDGIKFQAFPYQVSFGKYPVFTVGNKVCELEDNQAVYASVIQPSVPALNELLFRHSDLIVNWAAHGNPQKWEIVGKTCKTCGGTGKVEGKGGILKSCGTCGGSGISKGSPFETIEINIQQPNALNGAVAQVPTPPAGYVERDTKALEAQKKDIEEQEYKALKAVGLELLASVPSAQSGIAKQYDRKEINTFFYQVAVQIQVAMEYVSEVCYDQRYTALGVIGNGLVNEEKRKAALPQITIPADFDLLTAEVIAEQLKRAKDSGFSPLITFGLEFDYTQKLYGENSPQLLTLKLLSELDPLPFRSVDEKVVLKETMGCSEVDFVLSNYLTAFVAQKTGSDPMWPKLEREVQRTELTQMAQAKLQEIKAGLVPIVAQG